MKLRIKAFNDRAKELYENHSHFHSGDAGLDLFVVEDQIIPASITIGIAIFSFLILLILKSLIFNSCDYNQNDILIENIFI